MAWHYYIYYRVDATQTGRCAVAAQMLLERMHDKTGIQGRLLRKRNEPQLWMEIYEGVADGDSFEWELAEAVSASGLQQYLQIGSTRHTECFSE